MTGIGKTVDTVCAVVNDMPVPVLVSGSAVMVLNGIDRKLGDIDLFCATSDWFKLSREWGWNVFCLAPEDAIRRCDPPYLECEMRGIPVNVFFQWRHREIGNIDIAYEWAISDTILGIDCVQLERLLRWKAEMRRAKDLPDIVAIANHLAERPL